MFDIEKEGNVDRRQAWLSAWVAVATANDCKSPETATNWADKCLKAFDERFDPAKATPAKKD